MLRTEDTESECVCVDDVSDWTESLLDDDDVDGEVCMARGDAVGIDDLLTKAELNPLWKLEEGCLFGNKADWNPRRGGGRGPIGRCVICLSLVVC